MLENAVFPICWFSSFFLPRMWSNLYTSVSVTYSAAHLWVAPENVGLQKEQKYSSFACHTRNEVWLCVLGIRKKEVGNTKR
jgi:hypothetical protein